MTLLTLAAGCGQSSVGRPQGTSPDAGLVGKDGSTADGTANGTADADDALPPAADALEDFPGVQGCPVPPGSRPVGTPNWTSVSGLRSPLTWYRSASAAYVAECVLAYQNDTGGWPKNIDMTYRLGIDESASPRDEKSMIDNGATTTQIRFLATMLASWPACPRFAAAVTAGLTYLFNAQYPTTGGWPQVWPLEDGDYSRHITYNDGAMVHVLQIMRDIVSGSPPFEVVAADVRSAAIKALGKGVECVLETQIIVAGSKTGWCAQHDELTLLPVGARAYELPSLSGKEGPELLAFLMTLDLDRPEVPRQEIVDAVEAAVRFYDSVKIVGFRYLRGANDAGAADSWLEPTTDQTPIWARFTDLQAPFLPFFADRDGIKVYSLTEVGLERRGGYAWYVSDPVTVLRSAYPTWVGKWMIGRNVLMAPVTDAGTPATDGAADLDPAADDGG